jgi:hypothetical protein
MKTNLRIWLAATAIIIAVAKLHAQGYIVPSGVITNYGGGILPGEISVLYNPDSSYYTGFALIPTGKTQPTLYTNTFSFDYILDIGVRVFFASANQPIATNTLLSGAMTELVYSGSGYVLTNGVPFYLALYTGNMTYAPPDGIYSNPLFGWAKLVNNQGTIQLLDSALAYGASGIYTGTRNLIPVPEPGTLSLVLLGVSGLLLPRHRHLRRFCPRFSSAGSRRS